MLSVILLQVWVGIWGLEACFLVLYSLFGGLRISFAQKSRVSRRCVPRYQWSCGRCVCCCLTYSFGDQYTIDDIAAPPISSITATALRATCHIIGHLAADVSSRLAGRATWMQYLQSISIIRCLWLEPGQRNKWEPRGRIQHLHTINVLFRPKKLLFWKYLYHYRTLFSFILFNTFQSIFPKTKSYPLLLFVRGDSSARYGLILSLALSLCDGARWHCHWSGHQPCQRSCHFVRCCPSLLFISTFTCQSTAS